MAINNPTDKMSSPENQKAKRCKINDLIREKLSGETLKDFEAFLGFLKEEKINTPWARFGWEGIHTFHMKHKGIGIGEIGFLNDENHIRFSIGTNGWRVESFDSYLEGQDSEVVDMLMERLTYKCTKCRPDFTCSVGLNAKIGDVIYNNRCMNVSVYRFVGNMQEFTLYTPRITPEAVDVFSLEMLKKLILAKKKADHKTIAV